MTEERFPLVGDPGAAPASSYDVLGVRPVGPGAVLVEVADHHAAGSLAAWLRAARLDCREVVPAVRTLLLDGLGDDALARLPDLLQEWRAAGPADRHSSHGGVVEVPVTYDGEDLARVAELWSTSVPEVVRRHTEIEFVSAFCGFAPGFSYLAGLPVGLAVPRLETPRPRVPAGAVALADTWCGIYPSASPGGWLLLGSTRAQVWDASRSDHPALLPPGTRVRFAVA